MSADQDKIIKAAAENLGGWVKTLQTAQLRLRCAEIIFTHGSQEQRADLDKHAGKLYSFAMSDKK